MVITHFVWSITTGITRIQAFYFCFPKKHIIVNLRHNFLAAFDIFGTPFWQLLPLRATFDFRGSLKFREYQFFDIQCVNSSLCHIPPPSGGLPAVKVNGPQIRPRFFLKWRQILKHSIFSTSNENNPIRTEEYTSQWKPKRKKILISEGFHLTTFCLHKP